MGQNLRDKFSVINKLRVRSSPTSEAAEQRGNVTRWFHRGESHPSATAHLAENPGLDNDHGLPSQIASTPLYELDGSIHFGCVAEPPTAQGHAALSQAGVDFDFLAELPSSTTVHRSELPAYQSVRQDEVMTRVAETCRHPAPIAQPSTVSALSQPGSSMSEYQSSQQVSRCSGVSEVTPATSMSESDIGHQGFDAATHDDYVNSPSRLLNLNTDLTIPQGSIIGGPLTDSPTSEDLSDFGVPRQKDMLDHATKFGYKSQGFGFGELESPPSFLEPTKPLPEPEELRLSSPVSSHPLHVPLRTPSPTYDSLPPYASWDAKQYAYHLSRSLEGCWLYSKSISDFDPSNLRRVLDHAFNTTAGFYLELSGHADEAVAKTLGQGLQLAPTIGEALTGLCSILTCEAIPTTNQLISLAFLSLSLLGISLNTHDLAEAVRILHNQASSWAHWIPCEHERKSFENLVNDLWLLAEQENYHRYLRKVAHEHSIHPESAFFMAMDSDNFIIQVAQIFILCQSSLHPTNSIYRADIYTVFAEAGGQGCSDLPPSFAETVEEDYKRMRAGGHLILPDSYEALQGFVHAEHSGDNFGANPQRLQLIKDSLKILGGKYVARVAQWVFQQFQASAQRVVSHPQGVTPHETQKWRSLEPHSIAGTYASRIPPDVPQRASQMQTGRTGRPRQQIVQTPPRLRQPVKHKSSSDSGDGPVRRCTQHNKIFRGEYAESLYRRHMERTIEHGCAKFECHLCSKKMPRIDHFKIHMRKYHKLNVRGRSGEYTFEPIGLGAEVAEPEGDTGVAENEFVGIPF